MHEMWKFVMLYYNTYRIVYIIILFIHYLYSNYVVYTMHPFNSKLKYTVTNIGFNIIYFYYLLMNF